MADASRSPLEHPRSLLSAFLDDELDDGTATSVARHLVGCPECADELEQLRSARNALRGLPDVALPATVLEHVARAARDVERGRRRQRRRMLASAGALGAVVAVLAAAFAMGAPAGDVTPPVEVFVVDHVVQHGGGPMIVPVDLNDR